MSSEAAHPGLYMEETNSHLLPLLWHFVIGLHKQPGGTSKILSGDSFGSLWGSLSLFISDFP